MPDKGSLNPVDRRIALLCVMGVIALTGFIYAQVAQHEFIDWDDYGYYLLNPHLDGHFSLSDFTTAFSEAYFANWSPLSSISIRLGDALYGLDPGWILVTNAIFHGLTSIFLFLALYKLTGDWAPSLFVALAFAVHPLHVESVAWASERKDVLAGVFWIGTLWVYASYAKKPTGLLYASVLLLSVLALLAKPTAVPLPLTLLLLDYWPLNRLAESEERKRALVEKVPLFLVAAGVSAATYWAQSSAGAENSELYSFDQRVANAGISYWNYLIDFFWPINLSPYYIYPSREWLLSWSNAPPILALVGITGLAIAGHRTRPYFLMGWIWFGVTLVPMLGLIQVGGQSRADRYMYIPAIGIALALGWLFQSIAHKRPQAKWPLLALGLSMILIWTGLARHQVGYWQNTLELFNHAVDLDPDNYVAHDKLGVTYWNENDPEASEEHFRRVLEVSPQWGESRLRLALTYNALGRFDESRPQLRLALATGADPAEVHAGLGVAAQQLGDDRQAEAEYRLSLELDLENEKWTVVNNLAWLLATTQVQALRDPEEAIALAKSATEADPEHADYKSTLAAAYAATGQFSQAIATQQEAIELLDEDDDPELKDSLRRQLARFRAGRPASD
jgi:tetratricopeptide (TPR) repeat protein